MKTAYILSSMLFALMANLFVIDQAQGNELKLYSYKGYPYNLLIARSDEIKIIYSENDNGITCRVEVNKHDNLFTTPAVEVKEKDFEASPLASCLPRQQAKSLLSKTFS